jgi:beta-1,4-mannooligosaccharide/beta-1,4-mannosyl-N-acetylglucosamine phosphorylase
MIFSKVGGASLFRRYEGNPILSADGWPYPIHSVFNPGAALIDGETLLLVRAEDYRGFSHLTLARSKDGITDWNIGEAPTLEYYEGHPEERWGLEDPRIVWLEDFKKYAIAYVSYSSVGPKVSLALTKDFKTIEKFGVSLPPEDKDASLFPKKFGGRYVMIHRPIVSGEAHIWIAFSPDLVHWGEHRVLLHRRGGSWDSSRVGLGAQPIETSEGWLIIYHGVRETAAGSLYRVGLALLDLEEPWKVIKRSQEWVFGPKEPYEFVGDVSGVVFPTGAIIDKEKDELRLYYGAADSTVCVAFANMDEIVDYVKSCPGE